MALECTKERICLAPILCKRTGSEFPQLSSHLRDEREYIDVGLDIDNLGLLIFKCNCLSIIKQQVVSFWNSQGVDGFFVRDVPWWFEDQQWRDENQISSMGNQWNNIGNQMTYSTGYDSLSHNYTRDLPESYQTVSSLFSIGQDKYRTIFLYA